MREVVTFITVTNRPEFADILTDQYLDQDYPEKRWIVVDATSESGVLKDRADVYIRVCPTATVGSMRNIGLGATDHQGWVFWLDDDDWRSPDLVSSLVRESDGCDVVGLGSTFWVDTSGELRVRTSENWPVFASAIYRNSPTIPLFRGVPTSKTDSWWLLRMRDCGRKWKVLKDHPERYAVVCHGRNVHNPTIPSGRLLKPTPEVARILDHANRIGEAGE
jgi:hypothetical protein